MRLLMMLVLAFGIAACGKDSKKGNGEQVKAGSAEQCEQLWSEMDNYDANSGAYTKAEAMELCRDVQARYKGIQCKRTLEYTDQNGDYVIEEQTVTVDSNFCGN